MLNKIKLIGKILIREIKPEEKKVDDAASSQETEEKIDKSQSESKPEKEKRELRFYFNLLVTAPSCSITDLSCFAQGEVAERITKEVQKEDIIEVRGYLRNQRRLKDGKNSREIIVKVVEFSKLNLSFEEIDSENSNRVRLLGKIISDLQSPDKQNSESLSFFMSVPREGVKLPLFFCRVNEKELITEINEKLKKGDVILLEGFLQTKREKEEWISSIICYGFTLLDSDSVNAFYPLDNLTRVIKKVRKIDFSKPKDKGSADKLIE